MMKILTLYSFAVSINFNLLANCSLVTIELALDNNSSTKDTNKPLIYPSCSKLSGSISVL